MYCHTSKYCRPANDSVMYYFSESSMIGIMLSYSARCHWKVEFNESNGMLHAYVGSVYSMLYTTGKLLNTVFQGRYFIKHAISHKLKFAILCRH